MVEIYRNTSKGNDVVKYVPSCGLNGAGIISFFGCNLQCPFCFAQKYSYSDTSLRVDLDVKRRMDIDDSQLVHEASEFLDVYPDVCYLQLTGGEPIKTHSSMKEIIQTLLSLDDRGLRVILQTNGLLIGKTPETSIEVLSKLSDLIYSHVLFELSLKGTNPIEFQALSGTCDRERAQYQYDAYWALRNVCREEQHLSLVARLGTGHHRKSISFVIPERDESMFLLDRWSPEFKEIYDDMATRSGYTTMVCETINAEGDGDVNNYLHRSIPAITRCGMSHCINSRVLDSKACKRVSQTYGVEIPINTGLQEAYMEFIGLFEPMGKPDHIYCGRNEFPLDSRKSCPIICPWRAREL